MKAIAILEAIATWILVAIFAPFLLLKLVAWGLVAVLVLDFLFNSDDP